MSSNLVQHRAEPNVWDTAAQSECDLERWGATLVAGALVVTGVRQRNASGLVMVIAGAGLAWWAATNNDARQTRRARMMAALPSSKPHGDPVHDASEESFPASDPPSWTPITGSPTTGDTVRSNS